MNSFFIKKFGEIECKMLKIKKYVIIKYRIEVSIITKLLFGGNYMNLEQFRHIKQAMLNIFNRSDEMEKSGVPSEQLQAEVEQMVQEYYRLQAQLLDSDLSSIPFEEWEGLTLMSEDELDFSKTHANIDFSLLKDIGYESINLSGCNVKGIDALNFDENTFDEEFIKSHPEYFPDETVPKEVRDRFFKQKIQFADLIEYPSLRKCVNKNSFGRTYHNPSGSLVSAIGIESALRLFDENPKFVEYITKTDEFSSSKIDFLSERIEKDKPYEDKKRFVYECVVKSLGRRYDWYDWYDWEFPPKEIIPEDMIQNFPSVFIKDGELPEETMNNYYSGKLSLGEIRYYKDILKTKDISIGTRSSWEISGVKNVFGDVWNYIEQVPRSLDTVVSNYLSGVHDNAQLEQLKSMETDDVVAMAIKHGIQSERISTDIDSLVTYCQYLPIDEAIPNETIRNFIMKCGYTILQEYNRQNNYVLDNSTSYSNDVEKTIFGNMAKYSAQMQDEVMINSEEELKQYLEKVISEMRKSGDYTTRDLLDKNKKELSTMFPSQFLNYNLLENIISEVPENVRRSVLSKLELGFNGNVELLLKTINQYPSLITALENKDIIIGDKYSPLYKKMYDTLGSKRFLEINSVYGGAINHLISKSSKETFESLLSELQNSEDFISILNSRVYESISSKRDFDIRNLPDSFKQQHPELYLKENAPEELVRQFYGSGYSILGGMSVVSPKDLQQHPEWIQFLTHIDLEKCLEGIQINVYNSNDGNQQHFAQQMSLYKALGLKFSQEEILSIISKYGDVFTEMHYFGIDIGLDKDDCFEKMLNAIARGIENRQITIRKNMPEEFKIKYPDLFLDEKAPEELQKLFYQRRINPELIQAHPEWKQFLLDKNLKTFCESNISNFLLDAKSINLSQEQLFDLFSKYGKYLASCNVRLAQVQDLNDIDNIIKKQIIESITIKRTLYDESAKEIIGTECPDLFLDENAPEELKQYFYNSTNNTPLTFELLKQHKEWLPFIQDKNVLLSLKKKNVGTVGLDKLFEKYGQEQALKMGMRNPESVMKMLEGNKFELLSQWYDKLNFIPHYVVMLDFPVEQSDKFVAAGKKWSQLMRIERHSLNEESKSALLKASMCFGVFDNDMDGFNKVMQLFTDIPRTLTEEQMLGLIHSAERSIGLAQWGKTGNEEIFKKGFETLKEVYGKNEDGNYTLKINSQQNKDVVSIVRGLMEDVGFLKVLAPDQAHKFFGGFEMKYEPEFRDFLLENMEEILRSDYISYMSSIQKQWAGIKALNSNRTLTLDMALAFVKSHSYQDVEVGNGKLAEVSNKARYSQQQFDTLQQIYNYGKQRVFSSVPRVKGEQGEYVYEILRLDDPLAVAIGTLSDCCQELGNVAETCMEHSMVNKHGRVFVVKNQAGEIVAQSWVWRNNNVICFDNIEVPDKQMFSHGIPRGMENSGIRNKFTDEILSVYQRAAQEMVEIDEKTYSQLLEEGKITQEQYESLVLRKVTTGEGYSNIKGSFATLEKDDTLVGPEPFEPPVELNRTLYTNDSKTTQYILSGEQGVKTNVGNTPTLYQDEFIIYDNTNTREQDVLSLQKLEYITKKDNYTGRTQSEETENIISAIANNYNLNPETTRVIMNANFAIIYDTREDSVVVGDILYNTSVNLKGQQVDITDKVAMQIRMAIEQIGVKGKKFDISRLDQEQLEMCSKAMNLNEELDVERGISHGAR